MLPWPTWLVGGPVKCRPSLHASFRWFLQLVQTPIDDVFSREVTMKSQQYSMSSSTTLHFSFHFDESVFSCWPDAKSCSWWTLCLFRGCRINQIQNGAMENASGWGHDQVSLSPIRFWPNSIGSSLIGHYLRSVPVTLARIVGEWNFFLPPLYSEFVRNFTFFRKCFPPIELNRPSKTF